MTRHRTKIIDKKAQFSRTPYRRRGQMDGPGRAQAQDFSPQRRRGAENRTVTGFMHGALLTPFVSSQVNGQSMLSCLCASAPLW
jgi:hypothetical protein